MATGAADAANFDSGYARLLRQAWCDEEFCARLARDPEATLARYDLALPPNVRVHVEFVDEGLDLGGVSSSWVTARNSGEFTLLVPAVQGTHLSNEDLCSIIGGSFVTARYRRPVVYLTTL